MMGGIVSLMIEDHDWDKHFLSFFFPSLNARHLIYYFCSQMAANLDEIATGVVIHSAPASGYRKFSGSQSQPWIVGPATYSSFLPPDYFSHGTSL